MQKLYSRIEWQNKPSIETPLNEQNLNRMDAALDAVDDRVIAQDTIKADKTDLNDLVSGWILDEETGIITITKVSGEKILFDLNIEKIPVDFSLSDDGILTMTTDDGTGFTANIGAMIPVLTFVDSDEIAVSVSGSGVNKTYSFSIKTGSVTEDKLQPNYLAEIKVESAKAEACATTAGEKASESLQSALLSKSYFDGDSGIREGEETDNAKYYSEQAKKALESLEQAGTVTGVKGDAENAYRTGNVNITPENIGALPADGNAATATKAKQDGNGNNIADTYLPKSGGAVGGNLYPSENNFRLCGTETRRWSEVHAYKMYCREKLELVRNHTLVESPYVNVVAIHSKDFPPTASDWSEYYGIRISTTANDGALQPNVDNKETLGNSGLRWQQIYAMSSTITTSDRRQKEEISYIGEDSPYDTYMFDNTLIDFIMGLSPVIYKLTGGSSGRPHHGMIAQDVEKLLERLGIKDHAAFIKSPKTRDVEVEKEIEEEIEDPDTGEKKIKKKIVKELQQEEIPGKYIYSLRYEEFIADIIRFVQIQKKHFDEFAEKVNGVMHEQETKINTLEKKIKDFYFKERKRSDL